MTGRKSHRHIWRLSLFFVLGKVYAQKSKKRSACYFIALLSTNLIKIISFDITLLFLDLFLGNSMETEGETVKMKQQKLLNQNEIARQLGISRGTLSKWLKKSTVSPKQIKGQQKLYEETVIDQYKKDKAGEKEEKKSDLSPTTLLLNQIDQQEKQIEYLKSQIEKKDTELAVQRKQLEEDKKTITDFGKQLGELTYHAQSLSLPKCEHTVSDGVFKTVSETEDRKTVKGAEKSNESTLKEESTKHWWQKIFK